MGWLHARVVDTVSAAGAQLRLDPDRAREAAALGPEASRSEGSVVSARAMPLRRDPNLVGIALFIGSESLFFLGIVVAYVVFREQGLATAKAHLDIGRTAVFSGLLFASSATVARAVAARSRGWLALTAVLGAAFLLGQGLEYARLLGSR